MNYRARGREWSCNLKNGFIPQDSCGEKQTEGKSPLQKEAATSGIASQKFCAQKDGEGREEQRDWPWDSQPK